jgi:ubiquinone/menaquinone biosynthesis C-methylase UbiE
MPRRLPSLNTSKSWATSSRRHVDPEPFKQIAKVLWSLGNYAEIAKNSEQPARELVDAVKARPGITLLDVAAGNGNVAVAAAWRGATVVASDLTPAMVELGRERTESEGIDIDWHEADVEALPFEDDSFDVVASAFGAMFAPRPEVTARELFRVTRPGGTVGMVNWTASGFMGQVMGRMEPFAPPRPPEVPSPLAWGDPEVVRDRFAGLASTVATERRQSRFASGSLADMLSFFEANLGPLVALRSMLPADKYQEMTTSLKEVVSQFNQGRDDVVVDSEYLLVTAEKS